MVIPWTEDVGHPGLICSHSLCASFCAGNPLSADAVPGC